MPEVKIPDTLIKRVTEGLFERPGELDPANIGDFFSYWVECDREKVEEVADSVGVTLDDLCAGDPVAASKVLTEEADPFSRVVSEIEDPMTQMRMAVKPMLSKQAIGHLQDVGLKHLMQQLSGVDYYLSSHIYYQACMTVLNLLGFVEIDTWWEARRTEYEGGPSLTKERFDHPDQFKPGRIHLVYDDFEVHWVMRRGVEEASIIAHHKTREDMMEGKTHARTMIANTLLIEGMKTMPYREVRSRYRPKPVDMRQILQDMAESAQRGDSEVEMIQAMKKHARRDLLGMAFDDGWTIELENGKFGYHPRVIVEQIASMLENPRCQYFFQRSCGWIIDGELPPPDLEGQIAKGHREVLRAEYGQLFPENDTEEPECIQTLPLNFQRGTIDVDVSMYLPILRSMPAKRLAGIKSLSNLYNVRLTYATQSRLDHCIGVMHMARVMCDRFGITGQDKINVEVYALVHDWGHLTGSHPVELYFKAKGGFDHEEFAEWLVGQNKEVFEGICDPDDIVRMFKQEDPLHDIVDGAFGADRIYYLTVDPSMCGMTYEYEPLWIVDDLAWVGEVVVDQNSEKAYQFLDHRAQLYEDLYFAPQTQIADAFLRKLLQNAGVQHPFQQLLIRNRGAFNIVKGDGEMREFWKFTDIVMHYCLGHMDDIDVKEPMRHLTTAYHKAAHATVASLRIEGYEDAEPETEVPIYQRLLMGRTNPVVEGVPAEEVARYQKALFDPEVANGLEEEIGRRIGLPARHIIVGAVPNLSKLASEYAPVREGGEVKSLFDWRPEYSQSFIERANRMTCFRVSVHPMMYGFAQEYFEKNSFRELVEEVLG
ncbi:HD domain-containing protein [Nanoarchaeota archaeon]